MRFASLGSGSRGNATLIESGDTLLLVDCGFAVKDTEDRLHRLAIEPADIDAVLVTHEHTDHVSGVGAFARKYQLPVWLTSGSLKAAVAALGDLPDVHIFSNHDPFAVDGVAVEPIPVPHDAREPSQFLFGDGNVRVGLLTDVGSVTPHICRVLNSAHALLLEFNHDETMLRQGPYPEPLKRRIASPLGHLSNGQSAALLSAIDTSRLQHLVAVHLSQQNNTHTIVRNCAARVLGCDPDWIAIADQDTGLPWREVAATG